MDLDAFVIRKDGTVEQLPVFVLPNNSLIAGCQQDMQYVEIYVIPDGEYYREVPR
jgi:hypothetical protein